MTQPSATRVLEIFKMLNEIPRPSHHEEQVSDFLCRFAERLGLEYERDAENCVVIRKGATPGREHEPVTVLLNHMDMVCVGMADPLSTPIESVEEDGWLKGRGTSLGADNGIGLSMALAVLEDDSISHGPLEVLTTTNEEDGMSGASQLSGEFIRGRRILNLDSEDYDTITIGAAGALMQTHRIAAPRQKATGGKRRWYRITISGGQGGHSGVDINKGRASAVVLAWGLLAAIYNEYDIELSHIDIGEANASIATHAELVLSVPSGEASEYVKSQEEQFNEWVKEEFGDSDPGIVCTIEKVEKSDSVIPSQTLEALLLSLEEIPQGVVKMSEAMPGTVETSNNVGRIYLDGDDVVVTTHTRSFIDADMEQLASEIREAFARNGGSSKVVMTAPAWQEKTDDALLTLVSDTFSEVLGWRPRPVAMHFVLEAGYYVQKYPGVHIACIGPRIVEPHSTGERVELSTVHDIWRVLVEILRKEVD